jgi:hypothetical protein
LVDALSAAQLSNAVFTAKTFQDNPDLLFGRILSAGRSAKIAYRLLGAVFLLCHHRSSSQ